MAHYNRIFCFAFCFFSFIFSQVVRADDGLTIKVRGVSFQMVKVEGGIYEMCADPDQTLHGVGVVPRILELPIHEERVNTFYIGQTEVTQRLWKTVMGRNPYETNPNFIGDSLPVIDLTYEDCVEFVNRLNQLTKQHFRLPTEAEWEFAARGGIKSKGYIFAGSNNPDDVAWWGAGHSGWRYHAVATKQPNELGLYDMSGNISERCGDESIVWKYSYSETLNPDLRVNPNEVYINKLYAVRGGTLQNANALDCSVTARTHYERAGLRLALDISDGDNGIYTFKNEDGVKLDYMKLTESTVALTYNEKNDTKISGILHIPATVTIKGKQYKVTAISDKALSNNPRLKAVYIPATVNRIGLHALTNCDNLEQIVVDSQNRVLDSRENCNAIIDTDRRMVIRGCKASVIPEGIRHIGPYAFYQCQTLTGIQLPQSLLSIRDYAFMGCSRLTTVALPPKLILIENYAFAYTALHSIVIPDKLMYIRDGVFFETQIDEVSIPSNVNYIGDFAFYRSKHQVKVSWSDPKPVILGVYYVKGDKGNTSRPESNNRASLGEPTEKDPIGLYHLTKVTYDDGTAETVPDFEQYKYCARNVTLTAILDKDINEADGTSTLTLRFFDNDRGTVFRHTGNIPVGTNGQGIRIYDSNRQHFTLKWFNSDRSDSELFPRDKYINEHYDATEGVDTVVRYMVDMLQTLSRVPTMKPNGLVPLIQNGVWLRIGIVKRRHGVVQQFFPMLENQKYWFNYQMQNVCLYRMYMSRNLATQVSTGIPKRWITQSGAIAIPTSERAVWIDDETFMKPYLTEDDGTEYLELYEYTTLPDEITDIFASKNKVRP